MKNYKKLIIGIGITNLLLFIFMIVIPFNMTYKYLTTVEERGALILLIMSFLPFYIMFLILKIKSKKNKLLKFNGWTLVKIVLFCFFTFIYLIVMRCFYVIVFESKTTNIDNYLILDMGFNNSYISIFPKEISKNAKNVKYNYKYMTFEMIDVLDSDYDLYLEMELPKEEYLLEKERIKKVADFEKIEHGYYLNSSEEYIISYNKRGTPFDLDFKVEYYFVVFFDDENKIIYNLSHGYIEPYFVSINKNNIICESEVCRINNNS